MIDRYLLRYFLAVIDHGNFTRAAENCHVTQPTLSLGIARLEQIVGQPLFHRTNRRVDLTSAGARFAHHARRIEAEFNQAERAIKQEERKQVVRLGILTSLPTSLIASIARALQDASDLQVEFVEGRARELAERLSSARIEAALTLSRGAQERGHFEPLFSEGYRLAMPASHPLVGERELKAEALADNVMIVRRHCELLPETSRHFTQRGVRPFFAARTTSDDRALAHVAAGVGVTIMPDCFEAPGVARVALQGFDHVRTIGLAYREQGDATALILSRIAPVFRAFS